MRSITSAKCQMYDCSFIIVCTSKAENIVNKNGNYFKFSENNGCERAQLLLLLHLIFYSSHKLCMMCIRTKHIKRS